MSSSGGGKQRRRQQRVGASIASTSYPIFWSVKKRELAGWLAGWLAGGGSVGRGERRLDLVDELNHLVVGFLHAAGRSNTRGTTDEREPTPT